MRTAVQIKNLPSDHVPCLLLLQRVPRGKRKKDDLHQEEHPFPGLLLIGDRCPHLTGVADRDLCRAAAQDDRPMA